MMSLVFCLQLLLLRLMKVLKNYLIVLIFQETIILKVLVQEQIPGSKQDLNALFTASGNTFTISNLFGGKVLRLTYNNDSSDTDLYQRYTVFVPLAGGVDDDAPAILQVGSSTYSLGYYETRI